MSQFSNLIEYEVPNSKKTYGSVQRNYCLPKCSGEWIIILDDDNLMYGMSLFQLYKHLESIPSKFDMVRVSIDHEIGRISCHDPWMPGKVDSLSVVFRRRMIDYVNWDTRPLELGDWDFFNRMKRFSQGLKNIDVLIGVHQQCLEI